jgi:hypothetical protein
MSRTMRWWEAGVIGGAVLAFATVVNVVKALIGGIADAVGWSGTVGVVVATFGMGFVCGVIAWSGKGLHRRLGAVGDALVGMAVMLAFFTCCMLLFAPELLGAKLRDGGLMLGVAAVAGAIAGIWFGHDLDDEAPSSDG